MMLDVNSLKLDDLSGTKRLVHRVINQHSMKVVYQQIIDHTQNRVFGYEALTRPLLDGQAVRPDDWFLKAYELHCSVEADLQALTCIFEDASLLPELFRTTSLFVNVMPCNLKEPAFFKELESMFNQGVCQPEQLIFEIIEYIDYDPRFLSPMVNLLRSWGARIALDDFKIDGVHRKAISELKPDFIKIDRSLIQGAAKNPYKQKVLSDLVRKITPGHSVIAEGIENTEDLIVVQETGIALSQGFFWGRPASSKELSLIYQIELEKKILANMIKHKNGVLTDPEVLHKSHEIDQMIVRYQKLRNHVLRHRFNQPMED